jgi:hypothetical protein
LGSIFETGGLENNAYWGPVTFVVGYLPLSFKKEASGTVIQDIILWSFINADF